MVAPRTALPPERMQRFVLLAFATLGRLYDLLDRLAALVPPPRVHRRRYSGVFLPTAAGNFRSDSQRQELADLRPSVSSQVVASGSLLASSRDFVPSPETFRCQLHFCAST
jgi:Putative transposase